MEKANCAIIWGELLQLSIDLEQNFAVRSSERERAKGKVEIALSLPEGG